MGQQNETEDPIELMTQINKLEMEIIYDGIVEDKTFSVVKDIISEYLSYNNLIENYSKSINKKEKIFEKNKLDELSHRFERIKKWIKMVKSPYYNNIQFLFQKITGKATKIEEKNVSNQDKNLIINKNSSTQNSTSLNDNPQRNKSEDVQIVGTKNYLTFFDEYSNKSIEERVICFYLNNKDKFKERVSKGPPDSFRWTSWCILNELPLDRNKDVYYNYLSKDLDSEDKDSIIRDIDRTFSNRNINDVEIRKKETSLYNILKAFWNLDDNLGYCQGMNLIVGFLLIISGGNELDTFYLLISNFSSTFIEPNKNHVSFRGLYTEEFPLLNFLKYIFDDLLRINIPDVKEHLDNLGITTDFWMSQWLQTLFTIVLPISWLKRLWDCIYSENIFFVVKFGIVFTKMIKMDILDKTEENDVINYFKELQKYSLFPENKYLDKKGNIEELILKAQKIKINTENYMKLYKKEQEDSIILEQKMNNDNRTIFTLTKGDRENNIYKIRHRKTVLFHNPEEENIIPPETKKINEIQNDEKKIKKNNVQKQNSDKKIIKEEEKIKIHITKNSSKTINNLFPTPEKTKKVDGQIPVPMFHTEDKNKFQIIKPKYDTNNKIDKINNNENNIQNIQKKKTKGHKKMNQFLDLGQIAIFDDEESKKNMKNNNKELIIQKKDSGNVEKKKKFFETNKNLNNPDIHPQHKKTSNFNFKNHQNNNNIMFNNNIHNKNQNNFNNGNNISKANTYNQFGQFLNNKNFHNNSNFHK